MADDISIDDLGPQGDGIYRSAQGPVYIERTLPGDRVRAKVERGSGGVLRGDLVEIVAPSEHRITAPCPHYDVCGGCTLQHASESFYRDWKVGLVRDALAREGVAPEQWLDPVFVPGGTRRRVTFAAYKKKGIVTLGYFRRRSHQVTDIASCLVADPAIMDLRRRMSPLLAPLLPEGTTTDVFIQVVDGLCDVVITGGIGKKGVPDLEVHEAVAALIHDAKVQRVSWRSRDRDEPEVLLEASPVRARFGVLDVNLPPLAFLQPTRDGERALGEAVLNALPAKGKFADLFAGCGTFTGAMLARGPVDAYDTGETALRALDKAKGARPLRTIRRDLFRDPLQRDEAEDYDAVVFDPPRAGAYEQAKALAESEVPVLVGVSCNPATFARDARVLVGGGYRLATVKVVDQFTWSHHVELVACFEKKA